MQILPTQVSFRLILEVVQRVFLYVVGKSLDGVVFEWEGGLTHEAVPVLRTRCGIKVVEVVVNLARLSLQFKQSPCVDHLQHLFVT